MVKTVNTTQDDLTLVKGIGPKYVTILQSAGVDSFRKLAELTDEQLETLIAESGARRPANLDTWNTQARDLLVESMSEAGDVNPAEHISEAFKSFMSHQNRALEAGWESVLSWLPEETRKHGGEAVDEFIAGYRALLSPVVDPVMNKVKRNRTSKIEIS